MHAGTRPGPHLPLRRVRRRRLPTALGLGLLGAVCLATTIFGGTASAATPPSRHVDVVQVSGWVDPIVVDFLSRSIHDSEQGGAEALVIQLDSPGAVVGDAKIDALVRQIHGATVPIAVWIGGSGARAKGGAAKVALAASIVGMAPGARLQTGGKVLNADDAKAAGVIQLDKQQSGVLGNFLVSLDGQQAAGRTLHTATFTPQKTGPPQAALTVQGRLAKLDLGPRTMHTVASPPVAYLLLCAGLALVVFELFTGGVGIAAGVGAVALVLAA